MASSSQTQTKATRSAAEATLAKSLAPEEVRPGDFVTPLHVVAEIPSWYWFCESWNLPVDEPVRIRFTSSGDSLPLKVTSVCLPFILVKNANGECKTLDLRNHQLARLDRQYAKRAWKAHKKSAARARKQAASRPAN
jgi:hypothetical protein